MEELKQIAKAIAEKLDEAVKQLKLLEVKEEELPETIAEVYEPTASTKEEEIFAPIFKGVRTYWNWLYIKNQGETNACKIGINGSTQTGFTLAAGESRTIGYKDLRIKYIRYKASAATTSIQFIPLRPRGNYG